MATAGAGVGGGAAPPQPQPPPPPCLLQEWRTWDATFGAVALVMTLLSGSGRLRTSRFSVAHPGAGALRSLLFLVAAAQVVWVLAWPASYTMRRRTAFMALQRGMRVWLVAALVSDPLVQQTVHEHLIESSQGMAPAVATARLLAAGTVVGGWVRRATGGRCGGLRGWLHWEGRYGGPCLALCVDCGF